VVHALSLKIEFKISTARRVCVFSPKMALLKLVHPLKIFRHAKFHGPTLTGESFSSTSDV
jgi:hypothetical protein